MAVFKPRTRMVSFRLSEEEYQAFSKVCASKRAHSLSDFARETICLRLDKRTKTPEEKFESKLRQLDRNIRQLRAEVQQLFDTLRAVQTPTPEPEVRVAHAGN